MIAKTFFGFLVFLLSLSLSQESLAQAYGGRGAIPMSRNQGILGTLFDINLYYSASDAVASPAAGNTWDKNVSLSDIKFGYISESRWYWGILYAVRSDNQISVTGKPGNSAGVGFGYYYANGFNWRAYYKFNESSGDYGDGKGFQFDLGYAIAPLSNLYLGVALSFRQTTYESNVTQVGFSSASRSETYPFITLGYLFY